jgi:hypothetical protein
LGGRKIVVSSAAEIIARRTIHYQGRILAQRRTS